MPNSPKRQHFIPRFHLQYFAGHEPEGQVWTYDAVNDKVWSAAPENTAVTSHFYSIQLPDGRTDSTVEDLLASAESVAASPYRDALLGHVPTGVMRRDLAQFLALMYSRTPAMRRRAAEVRSNTLQIANYATALDDDMFEASIRRREAETGVHIADDEKRQLRADLLDMSSYKIQIHQNATLGAVISIAESLAPLLYEMAWTIIEPSHGYFITSDNPVVKDSDPNTHHPVYGNRGFLNKTAIVVFPLSPHRLLRMCWDKMVASVGSYSREAVDAVNKGLALDADQYLYAHLQDKRIRSLARKYKDSRPRMAMQGFGPQKFAETEVLRRSKTGK